MKNPVNNVSRAAFGRAARLIALTLLAVLFGAVSAQAQVKAYVTNNGDSSLSVIDVATNTVIGTISLPGSPELLVISPDNSRAYVTTDNNTVAVVDLATSSVIANVTVGARPTFLTQRPDGAFVYVNNFGGATTSVIDTATNTVVATLTIGASPANGIGATPDGASVWTADGNGVISVIDTATNMITAPTFSALAGDRLFGIIFSPNGAFAYLADGTSANAFVMDAVTHAVVATIPTAGGGFANAITPNGATVYQTDTSGNVTVIDTATNTVVATVSLGGSLGVAVTPDGSFAYVANVSSNSVVVISTATNTVVATIPVGNTPIGVAFTHASNVNVPPVLASNNASVTVNEGQTATNTGTVTDANHDTVTLTASVGTVVNNGNGTWSWSFPATDPAQSQTVTITGDDGHGGVSHTSFSLVVNDVAPGIISVTNNGPIIAGGSATITVTAADTTGGNDTLAYQFDCNNDGIFEIGPQAGNTASCTFASAGSFTVNVRVTDGEGGVTLGSTVVKVNPPPPNCSNAVASPNLLSPPNHKFVPIQILGVTNLFGGTITVTSIFQDEKVGSGKDGCDGEEDDHGERSLFPLIIGKGKDDGGGDGGDHGNSRVDGRGVGTAIASVRAERSCKGDGRVYHIAFTATGPGGTCTGSVTVGVARKKNVAPIDGGALFNSTIPASDGDGGHDD